MQVQSLGIINNKSKNSCVKHKMCEKGYTCFSTDSPIFRLLNEHWEAAIKLGVELPKKHIEND